MSVAADHSIMSKDSFLVHAKSWVEETRVSFLLLMHVRLVGGHHTDRWGFLRGFWDERARFLYQDCRDGQDSHSAELGNREHGLDRAYDHIFIAKSDDMYPSVVISEQSSTMDGSNKRVSVEQDGVGMPNHLCLDYATGRLNRTNITT
ncbi:hypothetical protein DPMN_131979, partial [Dreissena polymorpha]